LLWREFFVCSMLYLFMLIKLFLWKKVHLADGTFQHLATVSKDCVVVDKFVKTWSLNGDRVARCARWLLIRHPWSSSGGVNSSSVSWQISRSTKLLLALLTREHFDLLISTALFEKSSQLNRACNRAPFIALERVTWHSLRYVPL
jgi:hypothetical protein